VLPFFLLCLGFAAGQLRTALNVTPLLGEEIHNREVEGVIDEIDRQEKGARLILVQPVVEGLPPQQTPVRIRISFRAYDPGGPIPEEIKSLLRDSGLSHMLAIAGLHLGLVAGIVFFTARLLLVLYPPLGLRIDAKKAAAGFALLSTLVYLCLAGFPIPAQRSF